MVLNPECSGHKHVLIVCHVVRITWLPSSAYHLKVSSSSEHIMFSWLLSSLPPYQESHWLPSQPPWTQSVSALARSPQPPPLFRRQAFPWSRKKALMWLLREQASEQIRSRLTFLLCSQQLHLLVEFLVLSDPQILHLKMEMLPVSQGCCKDWLKR